MIYMTKAEIQYTPSPIQYRFWFDGKEYMPRNTKWKRAAAQPIEGICRPNGEWHGLAEELNRICNDTEIQITFYAGHNDYLCLKRLVPSDTSDVAIEIIWGGEEKNAMTENREMGSAERGLPAIPVSVTDQLNSTKGRENAMSQFFIQYNPYRNECIFQKNGKDMPAGSKFGAMRNKRFQMLLGEGMNWKGLLQEIEDACNDTEIELGFRGRQIDFEDLQYAAGKYPGKAKFKLSFEEAQNDSNILEALDSVFDEIKTIDIPELHRENLKGQNIFEAYQAAKDGVFEINVIATMSSGKSTLINAMLHTELLPSQNQACTAAITRIQDQDNSTQFEATCYGQDDNVVHPKQLVTLEDMKRFNAEPDVKSIDVTGNIPSISSRNMRLRLCDTPGPNNSQNKDHRALTTSVIRRKNAIVLYVLNATQMEINDDKSLLEEIAAEMKREGKLSHDRFIFVVNKCDEFDEEKGETVAGIVKDVRNYLKQFGIIDPIIIPTSAMAALLIRKKQNGQNLTRKEQLDLSGTISYFVEVPALHYEDAAVLSLSVQTKIKQQAEKYHAEKDTWDQEALIHTGVPAVEATISEYIDKYAFPMKISDGVSDIIGIINELKMEEKFYSELAADERKLSLVQEQIVEAEKKIQNNRGIYDDFRAKIEKYNIDPGEEKKWLIDMGRAAQEITAPYDSKELMDKIEA